MKPRKEHYRGKLPHFQQPGQWYSVTIALKGAIPKGAIDKYAVSLEAAKNYYQSLVQKLAEKGLFPVPRQGVGFSKIQQSKTSDLGKSESRKPEFPNSGRFELRNSNSQLAKARNDYYIALRKYRLAYDKTLHCSNQPKTNLTKENNRKVIEEALLFWEGKRLKNHAWCIMSNHFHWVLTVFDRERELEFPN